MKRVAVINDISGFGRCSLTAAIPVLAVQGIEACPLPTAVLTAQTGYDSFYCDDYTEKIDIYTEEWTKLKRRFDGISTGYFANAAQIEKIQSFISRFKTGNTLLLVDPVMADGGEIYSTYTKELCDGVKKLASQADVITPNLTELCILAGEDYRELTKKQEQNDYPEMIAKIAKGLLSRSVKAVIVTGVYRKDCDGEYICNGVFTEDESAFFKTGIFSGSFSGTGDLFSATVFGELINGADIKNAVKKATFFIEKSIEATINAPYDTRDGVNFEKCLGFLLEEGENNDE